MNKFLLWLARHSPIFGDMLMGFGVSVLAGEYSQLMRGEVTPMTAIVVISAIAFVAFGATLRQRKDR
ncbi:hypothetical protein AGMMS50229_12970 [Campylobacterota bacterium]|nr:hypothetical protein AGMMS50229_12970 [Campylobacterota bacterium]